MLRHRSSGKSVLILVSHEIVQLSRELDISLDAEMVQKAVRLGKESLGQEKELDYTLKKLEETRKQLATSFTRVANKALQLESKCVGTRNKFAAVSRDNRVLAMHLSARSTKSKHEGKLRDQLIQKYIINYRNA